MILVDEIIEREHRLIIAIQIRQVINLRSDASFNDLCVLVEIDFAISKGALTRANQCLGQLPACLLKVVNGVLVLRQFQS